MYLQVGYSGGITQCYDSFEEAEKDILHHKSMDIYVLSIKDLDPEYIYVCSWLFYLKFLGRKPNAY